MTKTKAKNAATPCPRCSYCGCVVRSKDYTGYEDVAMCRKCQKEVCQ